MILSSKHAFFNDLLKVPNALKHETLVEKRTFSGAKISNGDWMFNLRGGFGSLTLKNIDFLLQEPLPPPGTRRSGSRVEVWRVGWAGLAWLGLAGR